MEGPATLVFRRRVKPGRDKAYQAWVAGIQAASRSVPGFLGAGTIGHPGRANEFISIVRFDSLESLVAWEDSELRRQWVAKLPPDLVDGEAEVWRPEGLEFWFTAPGVVPARGPSPHKMALVLAAVVFLLTVPLGPLLRVVLADAPPLARTAASVVLQVVLMTYLIMPRVTRLLSRWLFEA
jgi:antibiotic biosynthesis monooxygenase (ABM) superfamily enzyme